MHEYEFRLVVQDSFPFLPLIESLGFRTTRECVYYAKPHFRFKNGKWESKKVESVHAVYHDGLWFKWVHSIETPLQRWKQSTYRDFLHFTGDFQDPLTMESRQQVSIDKHSQLYTFRNPDGIYRLVFEWEYGKCSKPNFHSLLDSLSKYKRIYDPMRHYSHPPYSQLNETMTRRSVTCVASIPVGSEYLYAPKWDGIFGLVYSYRDRIKEKWEGYECVVRRNVSLGDGIVFAAERLEGGKVVLLDVYQVRGHDVASWSRRGILTEFLSKVNVIEDYSIQRYVSDPTELGCEVVGTDGIIIHNVQEDVIHKLKSNHSIDLPYSKGYFYMPTGRIKCLQNLDEMEEGCIYEISANDGSVKRKRIDRFKGNTSEQLENVLSNGWNGPEIEPLPLPKKSRKSKA